MIKKYCYCYSLGAKLHSTIFRSSVATVLVFALQRTHHDRHCHTVQQTKHECCRIPKWLRVVVHAKQARNN